MNGESTHRTSLAVVQLQGSPSLPVAAVGNMEIVVRGLIRSNALPVAHTCFNELDVPSFVDAATLNYKLKLAMYESTTFDKV